VKTFLAHSSVNKPAVEKIGNWLHKEKGVDIWIDEWSLSPGDSLIGEIGKAIKLSDRLLVFLTPSSVVSKWVQKELATGLILELGKKEGLDDKFVIPVLLQPCDIPVMLLDKVYADFTNKSFDAACEELYRGILNEPLGVQDIPLENKFMKVTYVNPLGEGKYGLIVEVGVEISPINGINIGLIFNNNYTDVKSWFGRPHQNTLPTNFSGVFYDHGVEREPLRYAETFSSPILTSTHSYYIYFESNEPLQIVKCSYVESG